MTLSYTVNGIEPSAPDALENSRKYMEGLINPQYSQYRIPFAPLSLDVQNAALARLKDPNEIEESIAEPLESRKVIALASPKNSPASDHDATQKPAEVRDQREPKTPEPQSKKVEKEAETDAIEQKRAECRSWVCYLLVATAVFGLIALIILCSLFIFFG